METTEKRGRGRPVDPDRLIWKNVGLKQAQWDWLSMWHPGSDKAVDWLQSLVERVMLIHPVSPSVFGKGHNPDTVPKKRVPRWVKQVAADRGLSERDLTIQALEFWKENHK